MSKNDDVIITNGKSSSPYLAGFLHCRICHEEEYESCRKLESPCGCSGTVKYAHRECIQRWCDEKGNTVCEICLQKYEPNYGVASLTKKCRPADAIITIRESLDVHSVDEDLDSLSLDFRDDVECSSAVDRSASFCKSVALVFTLLLLLRHFSEILTGEEDVAYPFTLFTLLVLRTSGIVVPMYILTLTITSMCYKIRRYRQVSSSTPSTHSCPSSSSFSQQVTSEDDEELPF